jgi:Icc-related predicted phosphoesterase
MNRKNKRNDRVRIVLFSDTHGHYWQTDIPEGDILVFAGDFAGIGSLDDLIDFNIFLDQLPHRHKIVVAGNHDFCFQEHPENSRRILTNATYLQDESVSIMGLIFYGSPWQPWFLDWAFNLKTAKELKEKWDLIPTNTDVLITHCPPYGYGDLNDMQEHVGDKELLMAIKRVKPKISVFGHIHEGYGKWKVGPTRLLNVSVCDGYNRLTNASVVINTLPVSVKIAGINTKAGVR